MDTQYLDSVIFVSVRELLSLPVKQGGFGLPNPVGNAEAWYQTSITTTRLLTDSLLTWVDLDVSSKYQSATSQARKNAKASRLTSGSCFSPRTQACMDRSKESGAFLTVSTRTYDGTELSLHCIALQVIQAAFLRYADPGGQVSEGSEYDNLNAKAGGLTLTIFLQVINMMVMSIDATPLIMAAYGVGWSVEIAFREISSLSDARRAIHLMYQESRRALGISISPMLQWLLFFFWLELSQYRFGLQGSSMNNDTRTALLEEMKPFCSLWLQMTRRLSFLAPRITNQVLWGPPFVFGNSSSNTCLFLCITDVISQTALP